MDASSIVSDFVMVDEASLPQRLQAGALLALLVELGEPNSTSGAHRIAIERLYDVGLDDIEPYILQLMHVAVTHKCDRTEECLLALRAYLAHVAAQSLHVGLRMAWNIDSVAPLLEKMGLTAPLEGLRNLIESAAVNRNSLLRNGGTSVEDELVDRDAVASQLNLTARKQERAGIFNDARRTMRELIAISDQLRQNPDRDARKGQLRDELAKFNSVVLSRRFYLPVADSHARPLWVLRAVAKEAAVFSSRERAPYLLLLEVIEDPDDKCTCGHPARGREAPLFADLTPPEDGDAAAAPAASASPAAEAEDDASVPLLRRVYGETFAEREARLQRVSPYGHMAGWRLAAMVVKAGDDLRQEELALQLIGRFNAIWREAGLTVQVRPFAAMATTFNGGLLEFVRDALSIDSLKKKAKVNSLHHFFLDAFGGENAPEYKAAQRNFAESMASYSVISFLLNIKDRHNGNLMLARDGALIHIDFGFMFATSPGGINFESAPFKLSQELLAVLGGVNDPVFGYFKVILFQAFMAARQRAEELLAAVQLMLPCSTLPSFGGDGGAALAQMRSKFALHLHSDVEVAQFVWRIVEDSVGNWRTRKYDQFQTWQNGII